MVLSRSSSVRRSGFQANFASKAASRTKVMIVQMMVPGSGVISWEPTGAAFLLERQEDADDQCEERRPLDECRGDDHPRADVARRLRLARAAFHRGGRQPSDPRGPADDGETRSDARREIRQRVAHLHARFLPSML